MTSHLTDREATMTKTPEQIRRAHELLDHLEAHPESHDQEFWISAHGVSGVFDAHKVLASRGTTACAAGWTVLLAGGVIERVTTARMIEGAAVWMPDGSRHSIRFAAAALLGLDQDETQDLFHDCGDLADVRKAIHDIHGPRPDMIGPFGSGETFTTETAVPLT
jgi:hypothetical protein